MHITPALGRWESRVQEFEVSPSCIMNQRQSGLHENLSQKKKKNSESKHLFHMNMSMHINFTNNFSNQGEFCSVFLLSHAKFFLAFFHNKEPKGLVLPELLLVLLSSCNMCPLLWLGSLQDRSKDAVSRSLTSHPPWGNHER